MAIRRKQQLAEHYKLIHLRTGKKLKPNALYNVVYDGLDAKIFRNKLHSADKINIVFARRGKSERHEALRNALNNARRSFEAKYGKRAFSPTTISSAAADSVS